ncbi:MAG: DNA methyltransferase [Kiritimatiellia bacterium]
MPLSWNEIKSRAVAFSREWADETRETAEAKTFWDAFFNVFGLNRRAVASFEEPVRSLKGTYNRIDLFWKGRLLAEHKSTGKDLEKAKLQAFDYVQDLVREGRHNEAPEYIIITDFARLLLYDLNQNGDLIADFPLAEFHRHIKHFAFIAGYKQHAFTAEPAVNIQAADLMARLADTLEDAGYPDHHRQLFLVRLLFCLFANDTGLFDNRAFDLLIEESAPDGKGLGPAIAEFFDTLNTPVEHRQRTLDETLAGLPYVNGGLFADPLPLAHFNSAMRNALLAATRFDWSRISPAVFGALFQGVMEPRARRQVGAHYTSEANILKVIRPLFLDDLQAERAKAGANRAALQRLHDKLAGLTFLDPACGCGNFLVIAYREIRAIENDILVTLHSDAQGIVDISHLARVDVNQFYGIEIDEWPARIAEVAMWLMDHLMNRDLAEKIGQYFARLPLRNAPHILHANALRTDWQEWLPPQQCSYIMGNPPFVGKKEQNAEQKADMEAVCGQIKAYGLLDFVTAWYIKAAEYMRINPAIVCAFVSTNSISQGEQVGVLWPTLYAAGAIIHFAHRTFTWTSEARGKAHVHVVIIGWALRDTPKKQLFDYDVDAIQVSTPRNINPYLVEGGNITLHAASKPINGAPAISYGSMMIDKDRKSGGEAGLILTPAYREELLAETPALAPFIRRLYGGDEFLNNEERWCLWLVDAPPALLRSSKLLMDRIETVRAFRMGSSRPQTRELAATPTLFGEIRQPKTPYLLVPKVSSERRNYIPIGFMSPNDIASGSALIVPEATLYHFGVLTSAMHNAWMRSVAGRMKSDYQYSGSIVYNTFPWPEKITEDRREEIERLAQAVLDERAIHLGQGATLADLYDPVTMPPGLAKAHAALDRAVDRAYRPAPFDSERSRVEFLFERYQALTTLFPEKPKKRARRASAGA